MNAEMREAVDDIDVGSFGSVSTLAKLANRVEAGLPGADGTHAARLIRSFNWMRGRLSGSNKQKLKYLHERAVYRARAEQADALLRDVLVLLHPDQPEHDRITAHLGGEHG